MLGERSYVRYPKHCSECGKDYDIEVENITPESWKHVQEDIWGVGKCVECWNKPA